MTFDSHPESCGRFVLETLDDETECPIEEALFDADDIGELCTIIDAKVSEITSFCYDLDDQVVERLKARFKIAMDSANRIVRLRAWRPLDDLPYKVHTNRELVLMLKGIKPLAYFYGQYPDHPEIEEIPERLFDPYVAADRFVKREFVLPIGNRKHVAATSGRQVLGIRHVMYALPTQEWRINAMILLLDTSAKTGWSEGFERMQGSLLGYEQWQNDIFIERIYRLGFGGRTL